MSRSLKGVNDPQSTLHVMDHALAQSMYIKDLPTVIANGGK